MNNESKLIAEIRTAMERVNAAMAAYASPVVPAPSKVELPTEPGWYLADYIKSPSGKITIELLTTGEWVDNTDSRYLDLSWVEKLGNLTRLESRADTAKHFVAAYRAYSSGKNRTLNQLDEAAVQVAREEFGADV